ncbi:MAG: S49 family peptidase, partial [Pseudomonadales bacterium]
TTLSGALNPFADVPEVLDNILKQSVKHTYDKFIGLVSAGRDMTPEQADTLAQGRVWSASRALEHGLIDAIGSLDDAIDSAALLADVGQYDVLYVEQPLTPRERILQQLMNSSLRTLHQVMGSSSLFSNSALSHFRSVQKHVSQFITMSQSPDVYAQCLECDARL